ncbi:Short C-terminal domain-containing protein [Chitinophaga sp. YR573]|uniref:SHOCT domain-containing protein n=1 Tax=Chitinophaga sp. YR573 TaxID=1881040 RepID=UPI0008C96CFB|nr:SHOCT domain-containing protein [Chitinophaga sp. YR573]SEW21085.1 Short C-terminal domain-containing protein [Chitinophaga sp. YR573]
MKRLLLAVLLLPAFAVAQSNEFGKIENDTLYLSTGEKYWKGKEVRLGYGSNGAKGFEFITLSPWSLAGPVPLGSSWANLKMTVKDFQLTGTKRTGKKFFVVAKGGNLSPYWIDIVSALNQKEVASDAPKEIIAAATTTTPPDLAEQIKKLKELKDSGVLTEDQYNAALKKVIGN